LPDTSMTYSVQQSAAKLDVSPDMVSQRVAAREWPCTRTARRHPPAPAVVPPDRPALSHGGIAGVDQVGVVAGVVALGVVGVPFDGTGPELVAAVLGGGVGTVVGVLVGWTVVARGVVSFFGSSEGVVLGVLITGVPPDGVIVTGGGRSHM
jgi:hypothetical protein